MQTALKSLQNLLLRLIAAPEGVADGLARETALGPGGLDDIIVGDERLSAEDRVGIYADMYFYRILDVLKEDFPVTLALISLDNFHNLVTGYLIDYPSRHYSIGEAGRSLADFLRDHPLFREYPFLADLARLERALTDAFHAEDAEPANAETMKTVAPERWAGLRFATHPSVRILDLDYRVDRVMIAIQKDGKWQAPDRECAPTLVWRSGGTVRYRVLEAVERDALGEMREGATFAEICERLAAALSEQAAQQDAVSEINRVFARWLEEGLLVLEDG